MTLLDIYHMHNSATQLQFKSLGDDILVVAGGSSGIGAACVSLAVHYRLRVAIISRNEIRLNEELRKYEDTEGQVRGFCGDLRNAAVANSLLSSIRLTFGTIGAAIITAGAAKRIPQSELDAACWEDTFHSKFSPYIHMMQGIKKHLEPRGYGSIVAVVGSGGRDPDPNSLPASVSNAALLCAVRGLTDKLPFGVRLNCVNPGSIETPRYWRRVESEVERTASTIDAIHTLHSSSSYMQRLGKPSEVAEACLFLVSDNSSGIHGAELSVDGGGRRSSTY
jgi:NAD(P)-dependent dehydrogenase (short-subunit alcohol dehydrogenase family)